MLSNFTYQDESSDVKTQSEELVTKIRDSIIGDCRRIDGPFGPRPLIYADFIASGRSLDFVETAIRKIVLPVYGNTHTETSFTGREITALREEARETIRSAVGAGQNHAVIFSGGGATAAVDRLVRGMELSDKVRNGQTVVVFVGPFEHHSNDLPWRETGAIIERIALGKDGNVDLDHLEERLKIYPQETFKIGTFTAASNVTGIKSKLPEIARLLRQYKAYFVCDFAAAAPYIDMKLQIKTLDSVAHIDAIIYSPHKFIGGPGASGVLIADKRLFTSDKPAITGGGTVSYVTAENHQYVKDIVRREEAGTPNIVGDIRAGAVMALKEAIGSEEIECREQAIIEKVLQRLSQAPNIEILGPLDQPRIGVLSFNIRAGGFRLHYGFIVALLNDLFGVQSRGGCSCAGPYAHDLLGISGESASEFEHAISTGLSILRPGWVRIGYNYFFDEATTDYITDAIIFISKFGTLFLDDYCVDLERGVWRHKTYKPKPKSTLTNFWEQGTLTRGAQYLSSNGDVDFQQYISEARALIDGRPLPVLKQAPVFETQYEMLREFWLPQDIVRESDDLPDLVGSNAHA